MLPTVEIFTLCNHRYLLGKSTVYELKTKTKHNKKAMLHGIATKFEVR